LIPSIFILVNPDMSIDISIELVRCLTAAKLSIIVSNI
jgi:hypothetical protein